MDESTAGQRLRAVLDTAVDGIILIDTDGIVQIFNPACEKLFGYAAAEVIGQNVKLLMPAPFHDAHDSYLANYRQTGTRKIIGIGREVVGRRKDGTTFPMHLSVGEATQNGDRFFVGIVHDLSERKRTEEQLIQAQKMEAVGQLTGGIAHDFNNLLTVIVGNAEFLSDTLKSRPDLKRIAETVISAAERGAELTRRLLAFSRRQTLRPIEIDCNKLVDGMQRLLRRTLREDIHIRTLLEPSPWLVFADAAQLESAILNLALNAQDAMPSGGNLTITTSNIPLDGHYNDLYPEVPSGDYVMIAVTDDGQGMAAEVREHAFEPFFTTKEVGKGSGLGLSMVYGFVKQSNGNVTIYSEPGLGTTVRLYLPAIADRLAVPPAEPAAIEEAPRGQGVVLVAEDDPYVRAYAVSTLASLGYRVLAAVDGHDALAKLSEHDDVSVLFTDVVMPGGMTGWDLAERAKEMRPAIKVLLTSGYAIETLASRGRLHADMVVLNKPYRKAELARRIRDVIAGSPAAATAAQRGTQQPASR